MRQVLLLLVASSALAAVHPRYKRAWGDALPDIGAPGYTCDAELMKPSATTPTSVHSVRPADIKVIGALGDSLTAANGAGAEDPIAILLQYRGLNFQCGGDRELEDHITMTSILKKYNPKLFGQSYGIGAADVYDIAQFNIAQPGAVASDLPKQARLLVDRLNSHQQDFDMQNDWKLINIFIGGNDVCNYCRNPESKSPANFKKGIQDAVQILYDNVPRVIVSLLSMLHLEMVRVIDGGEFFCSELHVIGECKCEGNASFSNANVSAICTAYQDVEKQLETEGTFERDDFTLVVQQFFNNVTKPPLLDDGTPDLRFFAPDCFHFAQYGHAISASWLWRNLLEPVDGKTLKADLAKADLPLACPDPQCPFIRTTGNSKNCAKYMTPAAAEPIKA